MAFILLDNFYNKQICEIDVAYSSIMLKPEFKKGDTDRLLIMILDSFLTNPYEFSDSELKIISALIRIRETDRYIEFKKIYPILKDLISVSSINTRGIDENKIYSLINMNKNISQPIEFSSIQSETPIMKNIIMDSCQSPVSGDCNNILSDFNCPPIQYGNNDTGDF
jgi:hypothetical protein